MVKVFSRLTFLQAGIVILVAGSVLVVLSWKFIYEHKSISSALIQPSKSFSGTLIILTSIPIQQPKRLPVSGFVSYSAHEGAGAVFPTQDNTVIAAAALAPTRDKVALVSFDPKRGLTFSVTSLVSDKNTVLVTPAAHVNIVAPVWSGDGKKLLYVTFIVNTKNGTMTPQGTIILSTSDGAEKKDLKTFGLPIALSYAGDAALYLTQDRSMMLWKPGETAKKVSDPLEFNGKITFVVSPDRNHVVIIDKKETLVFDIDWREGVIRNRVSISKLYTTGVFDTENHLMLTNGDGTGELYELAGAQLPKQVSSYSIPTLPQGAVLLDWFK